MIRKIYDARTGQYRPATATPEARAKEQAEARGRVIAVEYKEATDGVAKVVTRPQEKVVVTFREPESVEEAQNRCDTLGTEINDINQQLVDSKAKPWTVEEEQWRGRARSAKRHKERELMWLKRWRTKANVLREQSAQQEKTKRLATNGAFNPDDPVELLRSVMQVTTRLLRERRREGSKLLAGMEDLVLDAAMKYLREYDEFMGEYKEGE